MASKRVGGGSPKKSAGPLTPRRAGQGRVGQEDEIQFVEEDAVEVDDSSDDESTVKTSIKNGHHSSSASTSHAGAVGGNGTGTIPLDTSIESMPTSLHSQNGLDCKCGHHLVKLIVIHEYYFYLMSSITGHDSESWRINHGHDCSLA